MLTHLFNWPSHRWLAPCLVAISLVIGSAPSWATDISWRATTTLTVNEFDHFTREGRAVFPNGDEAQVVIHGTTGPESFYASGNASGEWILRFTDGSGFTLNYVSIWRGKITRAAGIFSDGVGRFAGITGSATATSGASSSGPMVSDWTGSYELPSK